ncbi:ImmA/IrrE family metallo-endopeptidase [Sporosarcina koreensis]|uniref:ImmA/IrrE family metallo-endopeptidase n=1 Tax=Sporosarcina koreensis TaxID=334735 RepID=UPI0009E18A51|nr:ImmA/IrrE family metallo-endopeptidase [Sporosarcina koreensis]
MVVCYQGTCTYFKVAVTKNLTFYEAYSIFYHRGRWRTLFIKKEQNPVMQKLLLAEEFYHVYANQILQLTSSETVIHKQEAQAKRMAAYLLMPERFICDVYEAALNEAMLISEIADYFLVADEFAHY